MLFLFYGQLLPSTFLKIMLFFLKLELPFVQVLLQLHVFAVVLLHDLNQLELLLDHPLDLYNLLLFHLFNSLFLLFCIA